MRFTSLLLLFLCYSGVIICQSNGPRVPTFSHQIIDSTFRSESVTSADINSDGRLDIVIGDLWYEAPQWNVHEIRSPGDFLSSVYDEEKPAGTFNYYSNSFAVQTTDANSDGLTDVLVFPVMNQPIQCYLNPGEINKHWEVDEVVSRYHGESPLHVDLLQDGRKGTLAGVHLDDSLFHLCWITPTESSDWDILEIGHTRQSRYRGPGWDKLTKWYAAGSRDHGLGTGDLNGDGRTDVLTRQGWYQGPTDPLEEKWAFHPIRFDSLASPEFPQYQFAQMPIFDVDADGDMDFFASSAHHHGLWWFEQQQEGGQQIFVKHTIPFHISQVHAVEIGDLNKNGIPDIVLGKRYLAHNGGDPGWDEPLHLLWLEPRATAEGVQFQISVIHTGVGVGTQIEISDMNGDGWEDILVSNKKGTHLFLQDIPR